MYFNTLAFEFVNGDCDVMKVTYTVIISWQGITLRPSGHINTRQPHQECKQQQWKMFLQWSCKIWLQMHFNKRFAPQSWKIKYFEENSPKFSGLWSMWRLRNFLFKNWNSRLLNKRAEFDSQMQLIDFPSTKTSLRIKKCYKRKNVATFLWSVKNSFFFWYINSNFIHGKYFKLWWVTTFYL